MGPQEWRFVLIGDKLDIRTIAELFRDGARIVEDEYGQPVLTLHLEFSREESLAARDAAEAHIARLNATAQIVHGNHKNVHLGAFGHLDSSTGLLQYFLHLHDTVRSRARFGIGGVVFNADEGPPDQSKNIGDEILEAATANEHLGRALYLYGSAPLDWRGLYMVLDVVREAHGGLKEVMAKNWAPAKRIVDFNATANSYKAVGIAARHGFTKDFIDTPRMDLHEAREMVRTILQKWCSEAEATS